MKTSTLRAMAKGAPPRGELPQRYDLCLEVIRLREALVIARDCMHKDSAPDDFAKIDDLLTEHDA
jgi:hypothetical protein